jgi:hypothetical protein
LHEIISKIQQEVKMIFLKMMKLTNLETIALFQFEKYDLYALNSGFIFFWAYPLLGICYPVLVYCPAWVYSLFADNHVFLL